MKLTISLIVSGDFTYLIGALRSLQATTQTPYQVYVVINTGKGRDDPRVDALLEEFPDVKLITNAERLGFAANHNQVMRLAQTDYVALLNDDIRLHNGALDTLVAYLDGHADVGLVGPQQLNPDGTPQVAVYSDPSLFRTLYRISGLATLTSQRSRIRRALQRLGFANLLQVDSLKPQTRTRPVDIIRGVVMVVRRSAYEQAGLMEELASIYGGEEADWHWRLRQAGWKIVFVAESAVTHYGYGQAFLQIAAPALPEDRRSVLNYYLKHRPRWQVWVVRAAIVFFHSLLGLCWLPFSRQRGRYHFQTVQVGLLWTRPPDAASRER